MTASVEDVFDGEGVQVVMQRQRTDHVPANATDVDPSHLDPPLPLTGLSVVEQRYEFPIGHSADGGPYGRIVDEGDDTVLSDVSVV